MVSAIYDTVHVDGPLTLRQVSRSPPVPLVRDSLTVLVSLWLRHTTAQFTTVPGLILSTTTRMVSTFPVPEIWNMS